MDNRMAEEQRALAREAEAIKNVRKEICRESLQAFAKLYLPAHFPLPPSIMHKDFFTYLVGVTKTRGARCAVAAPRGHAKTTVVSVAYVLYCVCYNLEPFIVMVSNTGDQAEDLLSTVKHELESNERILKDFPEVAEPLHRRPQPKRWRRREVITRNGVKILALGAGQKIRGRKHKEHRPTLIILDDIENEEEVRSADQRENKTVWFQKALLKAGTAARTNVIVVGTILHYDSLLARLIGPESGTSEFPGWNTATYRAVQEFSEREDLWAKWESIYTEREEFEGETGPLAATAYYEANKAELEKGTDVLWPERETYLQLMELRVKEGRASFDSEKQNDPVDPDSCYFREEQFVYWDDKFASEDELKKSLGTNVSYYGACDPSLGGGRLRDDTAIVTLLYDKKDQVYYVLDADIKSRKPKEIIATILQYHQLRSFLRFTMETNQFQIVLSQELKDASHKAKKPLSVYEVNHTSDKVSRIQSLEPLVSSGRLRFSRRHRQLIDQLRQFPKAAHDDGPDALEMAIAASRVACPGIILLDDDDPPWWWIRTGLPYG